MEISHSSMTQDSFDIRGMIINSMTILERTMDVFLSNHFCSEIEKRVEIMNCLFATKYITFESKRQILNYILITHYKKSESRLKDINADLDRFNQHRITAAHFVVDYSNEAIQHYNKTKEVTFLKFEKSFEKEFFNIEKAYEISKKMDDYIIPLFEITN
jgi:hypothetical protein